MVSLAKNIGTCKLCSASGSELQDSHFVPKFMYKRLRQTTGKNPNPVKIIKESAVQTSWQETAYVLCRKCEEVIAKLGEEYASKVCWRPGGKFALRDMLKMARSEYSDGAERTTFSASKVLGLDKDKLVYFGASILWRGSVWSSLRPDIHQASLDSKLEEEFRLFLKGESGFPSDASMLLTIVDEPHNKEEPEVGDMIIFPYKYEDEGVIVYRFGLCGLIYDVRIELTTDRKLGEHTFVPGDEIYLVPWKDLGIIKDSIRLLS